MKFKIGDKVFIIGEIHPSKYKHETGIIEDIDFSGTIYVDMDNFKSPSGRSYQIQADEVDLIFNTTINRLLYV